MGRLKTSNEKEFFHKSYLIISIIKKTLDYYMVMMR